MNLSYKENYWDRPELKREFNSFLNRIFGLELSLWDRLGYWDNNYRPYSFFDGDRLVSSLCIYSLEMTVAGKRRRIAQVSAVGTLPEYRGKGLNSELTRIALEKSAPDHDFFFLFADREAFAFYKRHGFRHVTEYKPRIAIESARSKSGLVRLDMDKRSHRDLIYDLADNRQPVSDVLGIDNKRLLMFWCLYFLKNDTYYIEGLNTAIMFRRNEGTLTIYDIVGPEIRPLADIYPYLADPGDKAVEFLFMPDKMGLDEYKQILVEPENGLHLCGDFPIDGKFIFPCTCQA